MVWRFVMRTSLPIYPQQCSSFSGGIQRLGTITAGFCAKTAIIGSLCVVAEVS
jgi:hypothetical protein